MRDLSSYGSAMVLRTVYPCCLGRARLSAVAGLREIFDRICPSCGRRWSVAKSDRPIPGGWVSVLVWEG
jgi:hypothetical protein